MTSHYWLGVHKTRVWTLHIIRGCHISFLPFSEVGEWWLGTLLEWRRAHSQRMKNLTSSPPRVKNGEFLGEGFIAGLMFLSRGFPRRQGVSNLSPWRSYRIGSSFSSFFILRKSILWPPRRCDNPYSLSQSSWGGFYKELVKPYQEVVIGVRDGTQQGAIQTVSEVHKVEAVKLKDKCKVDFRIVNGG